MLDKNKILVIIYGFFSCLDCYSFNIKEVTVIRNIQDYYFGYSLLLQKGTVPRVIVGAPKDKIDNGIHYGGQVYECRIKEKSDCTPLFTETSFNSLYNPHGDFLGGALDGGDDTNGALVVCSPRSSVIQDRSLKAHIKNYTYTPGSCFYKKENINTQPFIVANASRFKNSYNSRINGSTNEIYFDYGYALFGFDISFFNKDYVLFGAPGMKNANGATISFSLNEARFETSSRVAVRVLPNKRFPVLLEEDNYFGYSVDSEIFIQHGDTVCNIAGEPRGNNLKGKAVLYYYDKSKNNFMNTLNVFEGNTFGSYFGASVLAVDVSNDNFVDILIGAPMSAGRTYEEGCVYFYRGFQKTFLREIKLSGSSTVRSRFGTSMVSLGDFDLDGYNDVAISAPFENNGEGAVYIYKGGPNGLSNECSQKLFPSMFEINVKAKGFGLGISKGNDIDSNGHNDIAIGAYKTNQVFIVTSKNIIDYQLLHSSIEGLYTNITNFDLELCLSYSKRSKISVVREVEFNLMISLDYRSMEHLVNVSLQAKLKTIICKSYNVKMKINVTDVSPFLVDINIELSPKIKHIIAHGNNKINLLIPYKLGCLNINCITGLTINIKSSRELKSARTGFQLTSMHDSMNKNIYNSQNRNKSRNTIILGQHKQFELDILVQNDGEPAHLCKLIIEVPVGIQLRNSKYCIRNNQNYNCRVTDKLDKNSRKNQMFVFDADSRVLKPGYTKIQVRVTSIGINKVGYKNKENFMISVITQSTTYIRGSNGKNYLASSPETIELKEEKKDKDVLFKFSIGKTGPSPVEIHVDLFLPKVAHMDENIFQIFSVQGNDIVSLVNCQKTVHNVNWNEILPKIDVSKIPLNRTIMLNCKHFACVQYSCYGGYLYTLAQTISFEIRILVKTNVLVSKFKTELKNMNVIAYIPIVLQRNPYNTSDNASEAMPLLIFVDNKTFISLWAYFVAVIIGIVLLTLIVFVLYKCGFFNRTYKEQLMQEKILETIPMNIEHTPQDEEYYDRDEIYEDDREEIYEEYDLIYI